MPQSCHDFRPGAFALDFRGIELHVCVCKAALEDTQDIANRSARGRGHDTDASRHYGQRLLARCVEKAFGVGARQFEAVFRQKLSVDVLEDINRAMGAQADRFLDHLPTPPPAARGSSWLGLPVPGHAGYFMTLNSVA